jgi:hypothetical protein
MVATQAADGPEPALERFGQRRTHGRLNATAVVMPAHDDVRHLEDIDRVLDDRHAIVVIGVNDIAHVALHEHFAGCEPHDGVGWHTAVGAPDPEVVGALDARQTTEVRRSSASCRAAHWRLFSKSSRRNFMAPILKRIAARRQD